MSAEDIPLTQPGEPDQHKKRAYVKNLSHPRWKRESSLKHIESEREDSSTKESDIEVNSDQSADQGDDELAEQSTRSESSDSSDNDEYTTNHLIAQEAPKTKRKYTSRTYKPQERVTRSGRVAKPPIRLI